MRIGLVGWGVETQSAYRYYGPEHTYVIGNEEPRDDFPSGDNIELHTLTQKRPPGLAGNAADLSYLNHYGDCDLVVYQGATMKNLEKKFTTDDPFWAKAKSAMAIFFEACPTKNVIGVTGTKGKGTTSSLIAFSLESTGKTVFLGGNIGIPVLDFVNEIKEDDWVVLELSNFQLYRQQFSPHIAVHLMMVPEHIEEWHKTMKDYVDAKRNIFAWQTEDDVAIYLPTNEFSTSNAQSSPGKHIPYTEKPGACLNNEGFIEIQNQKIIHRNELGLIGNHNIQNVCAATTAVWQVTQDVAAIKEAFTHFKGLEHRLQFVREVHGVSYYDDSFGTVPNTAAVAVDAFSQPKVLILGGHDKGNDWASFPSRLANDDIKHIVLIGTIADKLLPMLITAGVSDAKISSKQDGNDWTMPEIVDEAKSYASPGDIVLLSTGCASFGLFKDYKDRGNQFVEVVTNLEDA